MSDHDTGLASMTGFGRATTRHNGWEILAQCRSVNHKRLSFRVDTPDELRWLEPKIGSRLKQRLERGRVDVGVRIQPAGSGEEVDFNRIDDDRFAVVARTLCELADENGLDAPVGAKAVMEYSDFFERTTADAFANDDAEALLEVFDEALDRLVATRRREGAGIARQFADYLDGLNGLLDEVEDSKQQLDQQKWSEAEARLKEAADRFEIDEIDEGRLAQEVAYYVEKGDIAEEMQRARCHVEKIGDLLTDSDGAVGKKLDFYLQELIRETNTMGSKSRHAGLTDCIIEMKSIVEKMREQAANIE